MLSVLLIPSETCEFFNIIIDVGTELFHKAIRAKLFRKEVAAPGPGFVLLRVVEQSLPERGLCGRGRHRLPTSRRQPGQSWNIFGREHKLKGKAQEVDLGKLVQGGQLN